MDRQIFRIIGKATTLAAYAELAPITDVKAEGDHGRVFVTFKLPAKMQYMEGVRAEIYRGPSAEKIDLTDDGKVVGLF